MKDIQQEVLSGNVNPYDLLDLWKENPLSQEDIESLGFTFLEEKQTPYCKLSEYIKDTSYGTWSISKLEVTNNLTIDYNNKILFQGSIKNKSELKQVLKMIGYNN